MRSTWCPIPNRSTSRSCPTKTQLVHEPTQISAPLLTPPSTLRSRSARFSPCPRRMFARHRPRTSCGRQVRGPARGAGAVRAEHDCRFAGAPARVLGLLLERRLEQRRRARALMKTRATARVVLDKLEIQHPGADTELHYDNPYQLLVATVLSAQSTDRRVNEVTPALFQRYPDARALAGAEPTELEPLIKSDGIFSEQVPVAERSGA